MVRAATVAEVNDYRLRIHFDGWDDIYDDWFEAESFDLYPCGWCERTGHPLETPLSMCSSCVFFIALIFSCSIRGSAHCKNEKANIEELLRAACAVQIFSLVQPIQ